MATASAVASSGNIGPGFDVVALALDLRCVVDAEPADAWSSAHMGPHAPAEGHDLVLQAAKDGHLRMLPIIARLVDGDVVEQQGTTANDGETET